jgi:hypothetical protein
VGSRLEQLAKKYVWWQAPAEALKHPQVLLCQLMQLGTWSDVREVRSLVGDAAFKDALQRAPPGLLDRKSWNYWNLFYGFVPVPPMPTRPLP